MVKVSVIYDTKYGNTKLVAEKIVEGIREVEGIDVTAVDVKAANLEEVADSDAVLIGSPNHVGKPARDIDAFIDKLSKHNLKTKWVAVFDTHMAEDERAHDKMEKIISEKLQGVKLITPGLSIKVKSGLSMKGPIEEGELPKCVEFGKKIATKLNVFR
jgi:flavorubredoxin